MTESPTLQKSQQIFDGKTIERILPGRIFTKMRVIKIVSGTSAPLSMNVHRFEFWYVWQDIFLVLRADPTPLKGQTGRSSSRTKWQSGI